MRRAIKWGIPVAVLLIVIIYVLISYLIAEGVTKAERKPQKDHPTSYGLKYQDVDFVSRKGDLRLSGWYIPGESERPTLIFVHGIGGIRSGDKAVELASRLVDQGFSVLMFDLRGPRQLPRVTGVRRIL